MFIKILKTFSLSTVERKILKICAWDKIKRQIVFPGYILWKVWKHICFNFFWVTFTEIPKSGDLSSRLEMMSTKIICHTFLLYQKTTLVIIFSINFIFIKNTRKTVLFLIFRIFKFFGQFTTWKPRESHACFFGL